MLHISSFIKKDLDRQNKLPAKWYDELPDKPITDKCFIYVDAINNTGSGHSNSATTWKNLMGGTNGTKVGTVSWQDDALVLTRSSSTANGFRFATNAVTALTVEGVFELADYPIVETGMAESDVISNAQAGGAGLAVAQVNYALRPLAYNTLKSGYNAMDLAKPVPLNKKIYAAFTANSSMSTAVSSLNSYRAQEECVFGYGTKISPWAVGFNPYHTSPYYSSNGWGQWVGKIYSVRVHSRVLTDEEIHKNMLYERNRYNF